MHWSLVYFMILNLHRLREVFVAFYIEMKNLATFFLTFQENKTSKSERASSRHAKDI